MTRTFWTREECVERLRSWAAFHGRPRWSDWKPSTPEGMPSLATLTKVFGGWSEALVAAGLEEPAAGGFRWRHRTVEQELQIVSLTRDHSQREIAQLVGVSPWTVHAVQRKYHLVLSFGRSHSSAHFRYRFDEHVWGRALEVLVFEMKLPLEEVADRCGVGVDTVRRRMEKLGFRRREPGEIQRGRPRGPYAAWEARRSCATEGCSVKPLDGHDHCAACRRKPNRIRYGVDERGFIRFPAGHRLASAQARRAARRRTPARERGAVS